MARSTNLHAALAAVLGALGCGVVRESGGVSPAVREIVVGPAHACAVHDDGAVSCWSLAETRSDGASITDGTPRQAREVPALRGATAIALSELHGCALDAAGDVACWGYSDREVSRPFDALRVNVVGPLASISPRTDGSVMCGTDRRERDSCWHTFGARDWFGDPTLVYARAAHARLDVDRDPGPRYRCALRPDGSVECRRNDLGAAFPVLLTR